MRTTSARVAIGLVTLAAVVVLFIVFAGGDDDGGSDSTTTTTQAQTSPTTETTTSTTEEQPEVAAEQQVTVRNGKPVGGVKELSYDSGERVRFVVTSDVADEVHVHGYDVSRAVRAGGSVRFSFPAKLEGVFEIELEQRAEPIAELRVSP